MKATNKLAILSLLCLPLTAEATTYYVNSATGDDSYAGTIDKPFKTPKKGFSMVNSKGNANHTVIIAPGTYTLDDGIGCTGANQGYRVTVRGSTDNPEDVVLRAGGTFEVLRLAQNITVANLTIADGSNKDRTYRGAGVRIGSSNTADPDVYGLSIVSNCIITACHNDYPSSNSYNGGPVYIYNNGLLVDSVVSNNTAVYRGCGVTFNGAKAEARRCVIASNVATNSGDCGISVYGLNGTGRLVDCVVQSNITAYCSGARDVAYVEGCTFRGNVLDPAKGVHSSSAMNLTVPAIVTNCTFVGNRAVNGFSTVHVTEWQTQFLDCRFIGNTVSNYAAGINFITGSSPSSRAKIENCVFADNSAHKWASDDDPAYVPGGGAIRVAVGYVDVSGCVFTNNTARYGGALNVVTNGNNNVSSLYCTNCLFIGNTANDCGGGVRVWKCGRALFDDCKFIENKATRDMGTMTSNDDEGGGGVFMHRVENGGYFSVSNCVFAGNSGMRGGGVGSTWNHTVTPYGVIYNCVFTNNVSLRQGGGLSIRVNNKTEAARTQDDWFSIRNSLFAFNRTIGKADNGTSVGDSNGAGILLVDYAPVSIENCTVVSNITAYTSSGGLHMPWNGRLVNCIVAYNLKNGGTAQETINWSASNGATFTNCCTYPSTATVLATSSGYINVDPKFVDPANGDFSLQLGSPCIDAGLDADWMVGRKVKDLAGSVRISGEHVDIGCYERYFPLGMLLMFK